MDAYVLISKFSFSLVSETGQIKVVDSIFPDQGVKNWQLSKGHDIGFLIFVLAEVQVIVADAFICLYHETANIKAHDFLGFTTIEVAN